MTSVILNPTPDQRLKLRRLELDRAAICQALGIDDDGTVDVPMYVAALVTDCQTSREKYSETVRLLGELCEFSVGTVCCWCKAPHMSTRLMDWTNERMREVSDGIREHSLNCDANPFRAKIAELTTHIELLERENAALRLELNRPREATVEGGGA